MCHSFICLIGSVEKVFLCEITYLKKSYRQRNTKEIAEENYFYSIKMDDVVWDMLLYRYSDEIESNPYIRLLFNEFAILKEADIFVNKELLINNNDEKAWSSPENA
ncbi:Uncharacterised protein [Escherichia coli]|nr:Uncharacterised protein [Escherichia coli]